MASGQFPPGSKMNLSMLIDMMLQKTYHELTLLSDLLPRKSDIERKIEIIRFATNTRQQFIRLLALVKWAASAEKVDKCQAMLTKLDQQNLFFKDTADSLARMARETLPNARLPNISLPAAIDVLTTGSFNRLPKCIKERIVPPDPISLSDKKKTIKRLNEVIQNRLAMSKLPSQFTNISICEGKAKLAVPNEFQVTLTMMGDLQSIPWRLLKIEFLVNDFETGGTLHSPVHPIEANVRIRAIAKRLTGEKWGELVRVEEYITGQSLTISYWRSGSQQQAPLIIIKTGGESNASNNLLLYHQPELDEYQPNVVVSMESAMTLATRERSKDRLKALLRSLKQEQFFRDNALFNEEKPSISIKPFEDCSQSELFFITIDSRSGNFNVSFDESVRSVVKKVDLLRLLRDDVNEFVLAFHNLRCYLYLARHARNVSLLPVQPCYYMAFMNNELLNKISNSRLYIRFNKHPNYILLVDVKVDVNDPACSLKERLFLLTVAAFERSASQRTKKLSVSDSKETTHQTNSDKSKQMITTKSIFYAAESLIQLNPDAFVSSGNRFDETSSDIACKRKIVANDESCKRQRPSDDSSSQCKDCHVNQQRLISMVSSCNTRIPFIKLCKEFTRAEIPIQGIQYEANSTPVIRLLSLPDPDDSDSLLLHSLHKQLLVCTIRLSSSLLHWNVEYRFLGSPFDNNRNSDGKPHSIEAVFEYPRNEAGVHADQSHKCLTDQILKDWKGISLIYNHALQLRDYIDDDRGCLYEQIGVDNFEYKSISILYGNQRNYKIILKWNSVESQFEFEFGIHGKSSEVNPHILVANELQKEFRKHNNLPYLLNILVKTTLPISALSKISTWPMLGTTQRPLLAVQNISIITRTSTHFRLFYRNAYVIDITILDDKVIVKDGSFSKADPTKQFGGIGTPDHFLAFMQLFDEKSSTRQRNKSEFETPTSQTTMETDKTHRDSFSHVHGHHESPSQSIAASIRSPAFTSPSHPSTGPNSVASYSGQLASLSPANVHANSSPGFIQPSPAPPQSAPMPSPVSWPHSPQVSHGSPHNVKQGRVAASPAYSDRTGVAPVGYPSPAIMSHSTFARLVTPVEQEFPCRSTQYFASPLERYFGAVYLAKHLLRVINKDETLHFEKYDGVLVFAGSPEAGLQYTVCMDGFNFESLHMNVSPKQGFENIWTADELRILKRYFEIVVTPCKVNILTAFARLLGAHPRILKDAIKIMRIEMQPEAHQKWLIEWSFMTPPGILAAIAAPGTPAVVLKAKNLFFFQLSDINDHSRRFVFSVLYDSNTNTIQPTEFPRSSQSPLEPPSWAKVQVISDAASTGEEFCISLMDWHVIASLN
eukprot:gene11033-12197_t